MYSSVISNLLAVIAYNSPVCNLLAVVTIVSLVVFIASTIASKIKGEDLDYELFNGLIPVISFLLYVYCGGFPFGDIVMVTIS